MQYRVLGRSAFRSLPAILTLAAAALPASRAHAAAGVDSGPAQGAVKAAPGFRHWDPADTNAVPRTLSATGLYAGAPGRNAPLAPEARHYAINVPTWSDGFAKKHWVLLRPGTSIGFKERDDCFSYPDSVVFVQEFSIDTVPGDTSTRILWETRLLLNSKVYPYSDPGLALSDRWYAFAYRWNRAQTDAQLVSLRNGANDSVRVWPQGTGGPSAVKKWRTPSMYQCARCHRGAPAESEETRGRALLGFFTAQLNRPAPDTAGMNQLDWLFLKKTLAGARPGTWNESPRWRSVEDSGFTTDKWTSLDVRARSYIGAHCSGCHGARGLETGAVMGSDVNYDYHLMEPRTELRNKPLSWSWGLDTVPPFAYPGTATPITPAEIVPGYPEKSALLFRQTERRTEPGVYDRVQNEMPPTGTFEVDQAGVAMLRAWIKSMPDLPPSGLAGGFKKAGIRAPVVRDGRVILPPGFAAGKGVPVRLIGLDGRAFVLEPSGDGAYGLPRALPRGVYLIRAGSRGFALSWF